MNSHNIALGTAQIGMSYGVANQPGQISRNEAAAILEYAWSSGMDTLDTAIAYGESEIRLGKIGVGRWKVISKLPAIPEPCPDVDGWVQEMVRGSLERLKTVRLRGLLVHRSQQLLGQRGVALYRALAAIKDQGLVEKIGVSIYSPNELDTLWPDFQLDLVQAPFNIFDRHLVTSGWLTRLSQAGTEVHVRSVFLQGLLLMEASKRPAIFDRWLPLWEQWHRWLDDRMLTSLQACLGFLASEPEIDRVVVGVDSLKQMQEIINNVEAPAVMPPETLMSEDLDLIDPSRWSVF